MKYVLAIALLMSTSVFATGNNNNGGAASNAVSNARAQQSVKAEQNVAVEQAQGQFQGQGLYNQIGFNGRKNLRNAPGIGLPFMAPTSLCLGTVSGGGSFWLGGAAAATTYEVQLCMQMETIRVGVYMMQNATSEDQKAAYEKANNEVYCMTTYGKKTSLCPKEEVVEEERKVKIEDWFN